MKAIFLFLCIYIGGFINNTYANTINDYPFYLQNTLQTLGCHNLKGKHLHVQNFYKHNYEAENLGNIDYVLNKSAFESNPFHSKILQKGAALNYQFFTPFNKKESFQNSYNWVLFYNLQLPKYSIVEQDVTSINLYPKELGEHRLFFIQKNTETNCSISKVSSFYVTDNPDYAVTTEKKFQKAFTCYQTLPLQKKKPYCDTLPSLKELYHLQQIDAPKAWTISTGKGIKVALIDTGVNYLHPYLKEQIITSKDNSFKGPYDFEFADSFAFDEQGHGSQMAGFISSAFGVAPEAKVLTIKINPKNTEHIINALKISLKNRVHIINLSLVFAKQEVNITKALRKELIQVLDQLLEQDILVVQAAGNHSQDLDNPEYQHFFSQFNYPNWVKVAAYNENFKRASYSNYSNHKVDVMAPGGSVNKPLLSTFMGNNQKILLASNNGTSQAAAITSGIAALIRSHKPNLSALEVKNILLNSGTFSKNLSLEVKSSRTLNAWNALTQ
ncbi:MAG: S8 family serine peptidase [Bdellovibrionaceae bacterium]|nr:S8 family serine peptidase [Pseudobdellovibrionaceae bacterium]